MAKVFPPVRSESRIPEKMLVELYSLENAAHEITSTVNVSSHGARVLTKAPWVPNQDVSVRSVPGNLYSRAHVVYCKPLPDRSFSIGLRLLQPRALASTQQNFRITSATLITRRRSIQAAQTGVLGARQNLTDIARSLT